MKIIWLKTKQLTKFILAFFVYLVTGLLPFRDLWNLSQNDYTVIGDWYRVIYTSKVPGEIKILEYPEHYDIVVKHLFFWKSVRFVNKIGYKNQLSLLPTKLEIDETYDSQKQLRESYKEVYRKEQKKIETAKEYTIPEQSKLYRTLQGDDDA